MKKTVKKIVDQFFADHVKGVRQVNISHDQHIFDNDTSGFVFNIQINLNDDIRPNIRYGKQ